MSPLKKTQADDLRSTLSQSYAVYQVWNRAPPLAGWILPCNGRRKRLEDAGLECGSGVCGAAALNERSCVSTRVCALEPLARERGKRGFRDTRNTCCFPTAGRGGLEYGARLRGLRVAVAAFN
jgi:hypothetical protein